MQTLFLIKQSRRGARAQVIGSYMFGVCSEVAVEAQEEADQVDVLELVVRLRARVLARVVHRRLALLQHSTAQCVLTFGLQCSSTLHTVQYRSAVLL